MTVAEVVSTIRNLNPADRARAIQEIMEHYVEDEDDTEPLTAAQRKHLEDAIAQADANPGVGRTWEEIEAAMIAREER
jgi:hypothetical protein